MPRRVPLPFVLVFLLAFLRCAGAATEGTLFRPPPSPRAVFNFNPGWRFVFGNTTGAEQPGFDDSGWTAVSLPHTWNETDTYRAYIRHSGGDQGESMFGVGWYRKHFKLPPGTDGQKVFLQFDGLRQAARFYVNGQLVGKYENGVTAVGLDITRFLNPAGEDNVIAVKADNSTSYREEGTNTAFQWNTKDFNPNFGGLNRDATLITTGKVYQTLPLYENLRTTGVYVYAEAINLVSRTADVKVEAEILNETADRVAVSLSAVVVDAEGIVRAELAAGTAELAAGQKQVCTASGSLSGARLWDLKDPYLYRVYSILTVAGKIVDVCDTRTGFRHIEYRGGAGTGGVWLNGRFVWLTGYAQRTANDWAGLGGAYPAWMHDYTVALMRGSNANYVRWMHVAPQRADSDACDRYGVVQVCPAGDKEALVTGRQWEQRVEVMRATMIFYRNSPSIFFWEAGNTIVTPDQMNQLVAMRKELDPHGGRVMGTRDNDQSDANKALTPMSEYFSCMVGQDAQTDLVSGDDIFRGYSIARRDKAPLIEAEDFRDEAGRNVWDDASPPHFGFRPKPGMISGRPVDTYHWTSETFALAAAVRYAAYLKNRIDNTDPAHSKWSAYASIYFSDSDADGRQQGSYVLRVSGKIDGVRLPKSLYHVSRVMQSDTPDLHIIGHWTYPTGTKKTVYVAASHAEEVELFLNGTSLGKATKPHAFIDTYAEPGTTAPQQPGQDTGCVFAFPNVQFVPGTLKAVARKGGVVVAQQQLQTAGAPAALKLTVMTGPKGLQADGSDVALIDFEVVDAAGLRCPTDEARVDFEVTGPAVWRGGFNAAKLNTTNNLYLDTECGINRVAVRSTLAAGEITVTAKRDGLAPTTVKIASAEVDLTDGLMRSLPQTLATAPSEPGRLINLSVRAVARSREAPLIVGFAVQGGPKQFLVRGSGPALAGFGVSNTLADPQLEVHAVVDARDTVLATNDDWAVPAENLLPLRAAFAATGAFALTDPAAKDAALLTTVDGPRSMLVRDAAGRSGVTLAEVYDAGGATTGRLVNFSARNLVGTGDDILVAGFVITGNVPRRVLVRGIGPRLAVFGVTAPLADPKLELYSAGTLIAANDNWGTGDVAGLRAAFATATAFELPDTGSRDAALVVTLTAGIYSAQVSGMGGTTGDALVEVYELP